MTTSNQWSKANPYPWEKWAQLPQEEREAMSAEGHKKAALREAAERSAHPDQEAFLNDSDVDAVGNSDVTPIGRFPFWGDVDEASETEAVGHHGGPQPVAPVNVEPYFGPTLPDGSVREALGINANQPLPWDKGAQLPWNEIDPCITGIIKESGMNTLVSPDPQTTAADSLTGVVDPGFNTPDELLPSTHVIEAGENLREYGWNTLGQGIENVGQVMHSFGFDEAEDYDNLGGDGQKEGVNVLKKASIKGLEKTIQAPTRLVLGAPEALMGYEDPDQIEPTSNQKIREAEARGEGAKANAYHLLSPVTTHEEDLKNRAQQIHHDPNASEAQKIGSKIEHGVVYTVNRTVMAPVTLVESGLRFIVSLFDEDEGVVGAGEERNVVDNPRNKVFGSTPETLSPLNIDTALVTDAYQHQDALGADLIGVPNQGMDPSQTREERYEILA